VAYRDLIVDVVDRVGWITINRPDKLNALRLVTFQELEQALGALEKDPSVRVVAITGAGNRSFSTGIDLDADGLFETSEKWDEHTRYNASILQRIWYLDNPVVSAVNGYALAAGANLAIVPDLTIAAESARLGEPEIRHGALSPMLLLPWMMHMKAMHELYYTGDMVSAAQAKDLGLVNRVVPDAELRAETQRIARRIANAPGYALTMAKRSIRQTYDIMGFKGAQSAHRYVDTYLLDSHGNAERERLMETLAKQGLRAFLDARDRPYGDR
jgi:enoyl-CoA hydratase/carnithine racemase